MIELGWRRDAACFQADPETFFPNGRPPKRIRQLCAECPVRDLCLETALSSPWEPVGIWAGLSGRALRRRWRDRHPHQARVHEWVGA